MTVPLNGTLQNTSFGLKESYNNQAEFTNSCCGIGRRKYHEAFVIENATMSSIAHLENHVSNFVPYQIK